MDWTLSENEATAGLSGIEAFMRRIESKLRGEGAPLEGFTFLEDAREMLRVSREIEAELLRSATPSRLYVGFQNARKFEHELDRYRALRRSGVTVLACGEGTLDRRAAAGADGWHELSPNHRKIENQWYLVAKRPEPIAFVGWEVSDDELWGAGGIGQPGKRFTGFVSQDPRIVHAIASHLDIVRASNQPNASGASSVRDEVEGLGPRRIGLLADDGKREHVQRVLDQIANAPPLPQCDIYLYDLASASYLIDPYPHTEQREPFTADYVRNAARRPYLADQMQRLPVDGEVRAVLPTGVGFDDLGEWSERLELDALVLPSEYERPGLLERIRGYTLGALRQTTSAAIVIDDPESGPRVLRPLAAAAPA